MKNQFKGVGETTRSFGANPADALQINVLALLRDMLPHFSFPLIRHALRLIAAQSLPRCLIESECL